MSTANTGKRDVKERGEKQAQISIGVLKLAFCRAVGLHT